MQQALQGIADQDVLKIHLFGLGHGRKIDMLICSSSRQGFSVEPEEEIV
jgi:hypothetical protein